MGAARFSTPIGVAVDAEGNVIVADYENNCIRRLTGCDLARGTGTPRWPVGASPHGSNMRRLLADEAFADVTFDVCGTRFAAHRCILAVSSDYFQRMLTSSSARRSQAP